MSTFRHYSHSSSEIETEVIANILRPNSKHQPPELIQYCDFWWSEDKKKLGLTSLLQLMTIQNSQEALQKKFGKEDFSFQGNRKYKNYILTFDDLTFVVPDKRSVVLEGDITDSLIVRLIEFEKVYTQFVLDYVMNSKKLEDYEKDSLSEMKTAGIIDQNNKINFGLPISTHPKLKI